MPNKFISARVKKPHYYHFGEPPRKNPTPERKPGEWMAFVPGKGYFIIKDGQSCNQAQARMNYLKSMSYERLPNGVKIEWREHGIKDTSKPNTYAKLKI